MVVRESLARDILRLIVWYPLRHIVSVLPIAWGFALFRFMGDIKYVLSGKKDNAIAENIRSAFGEKLSEAAAADTLRKYYRNHYVNQMQIFLLPRFNKKNLEKFHTFDGLDNLASALKKRKGCILIHPHFGPAQMPLCALGILGYPMMQLGLPTDENLSYIGKKVAFRLRMAYESRIPARIVSADTFLRPIFDWLKENKVLMMTGDGAGGGKFIGKFIPVSFLNKRLLLPVGAVSLALKNGAPLLPLITVEGENGAYKTIIHGPIELGGNSSKERATSDAVKEFAGIMEGYFCRFPHLWHFWDEWNERLVHENSPRAFGVTTHE
jgi:phosphatidylinositol dimannoside acyltransferase